MIELTSENSVLCVWPSTVVGADNKDNFETWLNDEFGARGVYCEDYETLPDCKEGEVVEGTGGRNDALFRVNSEDIPKFAVARLAYGIRWWSDMMPASADIVPAEVIARYKGDEA